MPTPPTPPARMRTADKIELAVRIQKVLAGAGIDVSVPFAYRYIELIEFAQSLPLAHLVEVAE